MKVYKDEESKVLAGYFLLPEDAQKMIDEIKKSNCFTVSAFTLKSAREEVIRIIEKALASGEPVVVD